MGMTCFDNYFFGMDLGLCYMYKERTWDVRLTCELFWRLNKGAYFSGQVKKRQKSRLLGEYGDGHSCTFLKFAA